MVGRGLSGERALEEEEKEETANVQMSEKLHGQYGPPMFAAPARPPPRGTSPWRGGRSAASAQMTAQ